MYVIQMLMFDLLQNENALLCSKEKGHPVNITLRRVRLTSFEITICTCCNTKQYTKSI